MDKFIKMIKNIDIDPRDAQQSIIENLMVKELWGKDKCNGELPAYDSETCMGGNIYRGNIYIFEYDAKEGSLYQYRGQTVEYYDNMPIVLMTGQGENTLRGVNLNFCNKGLKTKLLNLIQNLDEDFYNKNIEFLVRNENLPISENVYKWLCQKDAEKGLIIEMMKLCSINILPTIRSYSIDRIKRIRLIEPWQWKYLPFLTYEGSLKKDTLEAIQKLTGIDKVGLE